MQYLGAPNSPPLQWWVVYYTQAQNQVSSRYVNTPATGTSSTGYVVVQAASSNEAETSAGNKLGTSGIVTYATGPYSTKAQAKSAASAKITSIETANQQNLNPFASLSTFFGDLTSSATWLRIGKVLLGAMLVMAGIIQMTHTQNVVMQVAKTAAKGAALA